MKIAFFVASNPYSSTTHFALSLAQALRRAGTEVSLHPISGGRFYKAFYAIVADRPDFTCSFSDITVGHEAIGNKWGIPHLSYLIDPVVYYLHQLEGQYSVVSCCDQEEVAFAHALGYKKTFFLPHGVPKELFRKKEEEKLFDVVFLGSCLDPEGRRSSWKERFSRETVTILEEATERVLSEKQTSCLRALLDAKVPPAHLVALHGEVDLFVEGQERISLLHALPGIPIHLFGRGKWAHYLPSHVTYHGAISFKKAINIMRRSHITLHSAPRFKHGSHERLFYSLASHSLPLASATPYTEELLGGSLTFMPGEASEKLKALLSNHEERRHLIASHRASIQSAHTWDHRAETLLNHMHSLI